MNKSFLFVFVFVILSVSVLASADVSCTPDTGYTTCWQNSGSQGAASASAKIQIGNIMFTKQNGCNVYNPVINYKCSGAGNTIRAYAYPNPGPYSANTCTQSGCNGELLGSLIGTYTLGTIGQEINYPSEMKCWAYASSGSDWIELFEGTGWESLGKIQCTGSQNYKRVECIDSSDCTGGKVCTAFACVTAPIINGVCGSSNNACTAGTLQDITDTTANYLWNCVGSGGGTTAPCTLAKPFDFTLSGGSPKTTTQGGTVTNTITATLISGTTKPVTFSINSGLPSGVTASFSPTSCNPTCTSTITFTASPTATIGTSTIFISVIGPPTRLGVMDLTVTGTPVNGVCSSPSAHYNCLTGTSTNTYQSGYVSILGNPAATTGYTWDCAGTNGGTTAHCSELIKIDGVCGSANNACTSGLVNDIADDATNYLWTCQGFNGGIALASCTLSKPTCFDYIQNQDETGVDCGGSTCLGCGTVAVGGDCVANVNCQSNMCDHTTYKCMAAPTCSDGIMNQDETAIDCGGSVCPACPTCSDGIKNQDETAIDCGGSICPTCQQQGGGGGGAKKTVTPPVQETTTPPVTEPQPMSQQQIILIFVVVAAFLYLLFKPKNRRR